MKNMQTNVSKKQLHNQSIDDSFSVGLPVGVVDMHQCNKITSIQRTAGDIH